MRRKQNTKSALRTIVILCSLSVVLVAVIILAYYLRHSSKNADTVKSYDTRALLTVTSRGGLCDGPCTHPSYNIYETGEFEGHSLLDVSEVSTLKQIIATTDFMSYEQINRPICPSFVDGLDQVLIFPQKYGDKRFVPCLLDIPKGDQAFEYINDLIYSHRIQAD